MHSPFPDIPSAETCGGNFLVLVVGYIPAVDSMGDSPCRALDRRLGDRGYLSLHKPTQMNTPTEPAKKRVPLTPDDIPDVCWVKFKDVTMLVVGVGVEGVCYSQKGVVTFDSMLEDGWEYSDDRKNWRPCYTEKEGA